MNRPTELKDIEVGFKDVEMMKTEGNDEGIPQTNIIMHEGSMDYVEAIPSVSRSEGHNDLPNS